MTQTYVTSKGHKVESAYTDKEAAKVVLKAVEEGKTRMNDFVASLTSRALSKKGVTNNQRPWLHKMAVEATQERPEAPRVEAKASSIVAMLENASQHLKWPKIKLEAEGFGQIRFSLAGGRSRFPGSVNVTNGYTGQENAWYGRIHQDGKFEPNRRLVPETVKQITEILKEISEDAEGYVAAYGRRTGNCCFCSRELSTDESLTVGYGPVCADNFGLPWGHIHPDVIEGNAFGRREAEQEAEAFLNDPF